MCSKYNIPPSSDFKEVRPGVLEGVVVFRVTLLIVAEGTNVMCCFDGNAGSCHYHGYEM